MSFRIFNGVKYVNQGIVFIYLHKLLFFFFFFFLLYEPLHSFQMNSLLVVGNCNSLFIGLPNVVLKKIQSVLNRAARLIFNLPPRVPTTSLNELHWLSLKVRIEFELCLIAFKALKFNQPSYIRELLSFSSHESTLGLQSADDPYRLHEPRAIGERGFANCSFSYIAPS